MGAAPALSASRSAMPARRSNGDWLSRRVCVCARPSTSQRRVMAPSRQNSSPPRRAQPAKRASRRASQAGTGSSRSRGKACAPKNRHCASTMPATITVGAKAQRRHARGCTGCQSSASRSASGTQRCSSASTVARGATGTSSPPCSSPSLRPPAVSTRSRRRPRRRSSQGSSITQRWILRRGRWLRWRVSSPPSLLRRTPPSCRR